MIRAFVADASVAVAWVHPAQSSALSARWLDHLNSGAELMAPSIWPLEVGNALLVLERRGKLLREERLQALWFLRNLPLTLDDDAVVMAFTDISALATEESLSVYDASYLHLAIRRGLPLACRDGPLRNAAIRRGLSVEP